MKEPEEEKKEKKLEEAKEPIKEKGLEMMEEAKEIKNENKQTPIEIEEKDWMGKLNYQRLYVNINKLDFI